MILPPVGPYGLTTAEQAIMQGTHRQDAHGGGCALARKAAHSDAPQTGRDCSAIFPLWWQPDSKMPRADGGYLSPLLPPKPARHAPPSSLGSHQEKSVPWKLPGRDGSEKTKSSPSYATLCRTHPHEHAGQTKHA